MQEYNIESGQVLASVLPDERARIVNLCAYLTGSREAAEDLAQETLIEAWRNRARLTEPEGAPKWLSVVARNICLRWMRQQGRQDSHQTEFAEENTLSDPLDLIPANLDLEIELERDELADLLDRALAQLPADTRQALIHRYLLEMPQAEIAARMGMSEGAVEARLHRGKLSLRRLLQTDLRAEADAYGLLSSPRDGWQETRLWCPICGEHKLYGQLPADGQSFELHCPRCSWEPNAFLSQSSMMPIFEGVKGYRAVLRRFMVFMNGYLRPGFDGEAIACRNCGQPIPLHFELPPHAHVYPGFGREGVNLNCPHCGASSYCDVYGIAMDTPAGQKFWQQNPKIFTLPLREIETSGVPAAQIHFQSRTSSAFLDVILSRQGYKVIQTHSSAGE